MPPAFTLVAGTLALIQVYLGPYSCLPDEFVLKKLSKLQHRPLVIIPQGLLCQCKECLLSDGTVDRKSFRFVFEEVSDLWRTTIPNPVNISETFSQREFTAAPNT